MRWIEKQKNILAKENGIIPFKAYDGSYHFLKK